MMAPKTIIDYIAVHELCHTLHRDHTDTFWGEVDKACRTSTNGTSGGARVERARRMTNFILENLGYIPATILDARVRRGDRGQ